MTKEEKAEYTREWQKKNRGQYLESMKNWRQNNPEHNRLWRKNNPGKSSEAVRKWEAKNPEKVKARMVVSMAKRAGTLVALPCIFCGTRENVDGHHPDYLKPLEVIWMCRKHHMEHHRNKEEHTPDDVSV